MGSDSYQFREEIYELAFGDDAINRNFSDEEVIEEIRRFSDKAMFYEAFTEAGINVNDVASEYDVEYKD